MNERKNVWLSQIYHQLLKNCPFPPVCLGHLLVLSTQQALNPSFQADLNLCSAQQIFPGHDDPRGRAEQACPRQGGRAAESGGLIDSVQPPLPSPDPPGSPAGGGVSASSLSPKVLSSRSSSEVSIAPPPVSRPAFQGPMPPAGPSHRPRVSLL